MCQPTSTIGLLSLFCFLGLQAVELMQAQWKRGLETTSGLKQNHQTYELEKCQNVSANINDWPSQSPLLSWPANCTAIASPMEKGAGNQKPGKTSGLNVSPRPLLPTSTITIGLLSLFCFLGLQAVELMQAQWERVQATKSEAKLKKQTYDHVLFLTSVRIIRPTSATGLVGLFCFLGLQATELMQAQWKRGQATRSKVKQDNQTHDHFLCLIAFRMFQPRSAISLSLLSLFCFLGLQESIEQAQWKRPVTRLP